MVKVPEHVAKIADKYISRDGGPPAKHGFLTPAAMTDLSPVYVGVDYGMLDDGMPHDGSAMTFAKIAQAMERMRSRPPRHVVVLDEIAVDEKLRAILQAKADFGAFLYAARRLQSFIPAKQSIEPVEPAERNPRAPRIALDMNRQPRSPRASRTPYLAKQRAGKHKV